MKITLYLVDRIKEFILPTQISGGFSFDANDLEENKLINIEAKDNSWVLYSTDDIFVIDGNNTTVTETILREYSFYILQRAGQNYLIYVSPTFETGITPYTYHDNIRLIIGNNTNCNVLYNIPYLTETNIEIVKKNGMLLLKKNNNTIIYVNKIALREQLYYLKIGDTLDVYGFRILVLPNLLIMNNPNGSVVVNDISTNTARFAINQGDDYINDDIKNEDLYGKDSYFSKSPRIRRIIETKEIKFDAPPEDSKNEEMPLLYTLGPMLSMGIVSCTMLINTINRLSNGQSTMSDSWPSLVSGVAMLLSTLLWPLLTKRYNKKLKKQKSQELLEKYSKYLEEKSKELEEESRLQKDILLENLITIPECINMIKNRNMFFWDKRIEQNDFLVTRLGMGRAKLDVNIQYPEKGFTIDESELRKEADKTVEKYKYIDNVPVAYSFSKNKITAIMGERAKSIYFVDNILLQLLTFYSYDDLKIVLITNEENKSHWDYIKYLNHNFDNAKQLRFFATNTEDIKRVTSYLEYELQNRLNNTEVSIRKPHYLLIIDDYSEIRKTNFMKTLVEVDAEIGFSTIIIERKLNKLPSKCVNFIQLGDKESAVMENSYEKQEITNFTDEINYGVNMMGVSKILSNIPIEFENGVKQLPDSINFLEMEKVGKVEQLNVLNRWNTNDSTESLKAEIGVDENGDYMYLDLHEKFHGPHGLIAGTTGSGKSEFIITYVLSMAINYSPEDVSFILIDYKGGGLALAFENKTAGIYLPHLAGTITNLDKAEMDRTLVSITSESKRRQRVFNEAREKLGESTIDIYKYQKAYHEGRLDEPIPHLFIVCDEFAELKSQQPEFMDNLISIARIGRSLGIHLILATQKPSGVVNDQIWSNSKFKVCLKVQDAADSKEMLKRPDAANIKETGRFYLQVGYDEYFALGQSAWCGAKYYPSEKIVKDIDKSLKFIDNTATIIKSIQSGKSIKKEAKGEQLANILNTVIEVSNQVNKKANRLWLPNIDEVILIDDLIKKYSYKTNIFPEAIIGEYDAPELQEQGILKYKFIEQGNTLIYGNDSAEKEMLLSSMIYSTSILYSTKQINYYIYDFGSESLRKFEKMPQVGDIVYIGEDEKVRNLFKLIKKEMAYRKKLLSSFGGEYSDYIKSQNQKEILPCKVIIINNFDSFTELYPTMTDDLIPIVRDCLRYGIVIIATLSSMSSMSRRLRQNFTNNYALRLSDPSDYMSIFNSRKKIIPRNMVGRGLFSTGEVHEFQTASLLREKDEEVVKLKEISEKLQQINTYKVPKVPSLPDYVTYDMIKEKIGKINSIPVGIEREELEVATYDFTMFPSSAISSNRLTNITPFITDLLKEMYQLKNLKLIVIDPYNYLDFLKNTNVRYINSDYDDEINNLYNDICEINKNKETTRTFCIMYGVERLKTKLTDTKKLGEFTKEVKKSDNYNLIICDDTKKLKSLDFESWYSDVKNNTDGIWIGKGLSDQYTFKISKITKDMTKEYKNNYAYIITESSAKLIKTIDFDGRITGDDNDEE